jgi:hypothetical protein
VEYLSLIFLHVLFGVLWAGGAVIVGLFILPAVIEAGPAGGAVMAGVNRRKLPIAMMTLGLLVLLTGARLYMLRFTTTWLTSPEGLVITAGAILAIGAFVMGLVVQKPTVERMSALAAQMAATGAAPTPEQASELQRLRARMRRTGALIAWHLLAAAALMAIHRLASTI